MYRCPECNECQPSLEAAIRHCQQETAPSDEAAGRAMAEPSRNGVSKPGQPQGILASADPRPLPGDPIAFDDCGHPTIARQVDPDTGAARTIVRNLDGTQRVFGWSTVQSLITSVEDEATSWIGSLSAHQLRGLVHEVGQRLIEHSRTYHEKKGEWQSLKERVDYMYFGLDEEATEKELDMAYRKLAKVMHPDKNGGTEEAKLRFQSMKERYEGLKERRGSAASVEGEAPAPASAGKGDEKAEGVRSCLEDGDAPRQDGRRREAYDEDDPPEGGAGKPSEERVKIEYDPKVRESMDETLWKMLRELKHFEVRMKPLYSEVRRLQQLLEASPPPEPTQDVHPSASGPPFIAAPA